MVTLGLFKKATQFLSIFIVSFFFAQAVEKDTSFTIHSEYKKVLKKFPNITIAVSNTKAALSETLNIVYKKTESRSLHLDAFINNNTPLRPAVISIHGGGWKSGSKEMQNPLAREIAALGYQSFTVEYRLSDEAKYPAAIDDVLDAINYIKKNAAEFKVDTARIALIGTSSGAQMASLIGTKYPKAVDAVINIDGILAFHHPDSEEAKLAALWLGGTYEEARKNWEDASAIIHVSCRSAPTLFINSQFKRFSAGRDDMIRKMNKHGIYSKVEPIENSPHTFWLFEPWFPTVIEHINNFLNLTFTKP